MTTQTQAIQGAEGHWRRFLDSRSPAAREGLIRHYWPLVLGAAKAFRNKLPPGVGLDDLTSAGALGLMQSLDSYDASRGVRFEAFCFKRVRGAMVDELRHAGWLPPAAQQRARKASQARDQLQAALGRRPTDAEIAAELGVATDKVVRALREADAPRGVSLDRNLAGQDAHQADQHQFLKDPAASDPADRAADRELVERTIRSLEPRDRLIVMMHYFEGMTMKEISHVLGVSQGRVSQRHTAILRQLRESVSVHGERRTAG